MVFHMTKYGGNVKINPWVGSFKATTKYHVSTTTTRRLSCHSPVKPKWFGKLHAFYDCFFANHKILATKKTKRKKSTWIAWILPNCCDCSQSESKTHSRAKAITANWSKYTRTLLTTDILLFIIFVIVSSRDFTDLVSSQEFQSRQSCHCGFLQSLKETDWIVGIFHWTDELENCGWYERRWSTGGGRRPSASGGYLSRWQWHTISLVAISACQAKLTHH